MQCFKLGFYGFDITNKKAVIFDNGTSKFDTTTLSTVGDAVASVLAKPERFVNEYVYISSFTTSQSEILAALKRVTGLDWAVEHKSAEDYKKEGKEKLAAGNPYGTYDLIFAAMFQSGNGADFSSHRKISNKELGLQVEDLGKVTKEVVETDRHVVKW